jgi:transcriptional regulator with XRE-family HTH domain
MTGYSLKLRDTNDEAPGNLLGVKLGRACIKRNVAVSEVAKRMGVTRQTVYNWFTGETDPLDPDTIAKIETFLNELD